MVLDAAQPAHLLTAAGPTGPAVHQSGQRRSVAGGLAGVVPVQHQQPPVPRCDTQHDLAGDIRVVGDQRTDQAALSADGKRDRVGDGVVADQGADRAEGLHLVRLGAVAVGAQQDR